MRCQWNVIGKLNDIMNEIMNDKMNDIMNDITNVRMNGIVGNLLMIW